jgi:hypothetical protein
MKKIIILFLLVFGLFFGNWVFASDFVWPCPAWQINNWNGCVEQESSSWQWDCTYDWNWNPLSSLQNCFNGSALVEGETEITSWFAYTLKKWTNTISTFLAVFAVFWIVFGGFRFTMSVWEDEKITKAKNIIKWAIVGFLWVLTASLIINLVINVMYSL